MTGSLSVVSVLVFVLGGVLIAAVGVVLSVRGLRERRVGSEPRCGGCEFDLTGIAEDAECPECGAGVDRRVRGTPRRQPWLLLSGGLLVAAVLCVGVLLVPVAARANWNAVKPLWLLKYDARSASAPRASGAAAELRSRIAGGRLVEAEVAELVQIGLERQADLALAWVPEWGDLLHDAWLDGRLTIEEARMFVDQALSAQVLAPPRAIAGRAVSVGLELSGPRGPGGESIRVVNGPTRIVLIDEAGGEVAILERDRGGLLAVGHGGRTSSSFTLDLAASLETGLYRVVVETRQAVIPREPDFGIGVDWSAIASGDVGSLPDRGFVRELEVEAPIEVLAVGTPLWRYVRPVGDEAVVEGVRQGVVIDEMTPQGAMLTLHNLPAPVAFVVEWRASGSEGPWRAHSTVVGMASAGSHGFGSMGLDGVEAGDRVDVRLRPDLGVAFDKGLEEIWWGEVVFEGVEVTAGRAGTVIVPADAGVLPLPVGSGGP